MVEELFSRGRGGKTVAQRGGGNSSQRKRKGGGGTTSQRVKRLNTICKKRATNLDIR